MINRLKGIFDLLELERASLFESLQHISNEQLQHRPSVESWSVIQVLDHMIQVERVSLLYLKKKIKAGSKMEEASFTSGFRTFILVLSLNSPLKFKAPKSLAQPANVKDLGEMLHIWNAVRKDLMKYLGAYPESLLDKAIFKHPLSGRIKIDQTLQFFRAHQNNHVKQVKRTLKKVND
ncbi:MAG: hypothetical protein ACI9A7_000597 [Cyclobacteriaceae bacterium]|jgi:hypothetical protein